jgi:hypothetical protein
MGGRARQIDGLAGSRGDGYNGQTSVMVESNQVYSRDGNFDRVGVQRSIAMFANGGLVPAGSSLERYTDPSSFEASLRYSDGSAVAIRPSNRDCVWSRRRAFGRSTKRGKPGLPRAG